eukprot:7836054-Pyramimonas_sp.AAC.1
MPKYRGSELCGRCGTKAETLKHRIWECEYNTGSFAYTEPDQLVSQTRVQSDADEALWLRSLMPQP